MVNLDRFRSQTIGSLNGLSQGAGEIGGVDPSSNQVLSLAGMAPVEVISRPSNGETRTSRNETDSTPTGPYSIRPKGVEDLFTRIWLVQYPRLRCWMARSRIGKGLKGEEIEDALGKVGMNLFRKIVKESEIPETLCSWRETNMESWLYTNANNRLVEAVRARRCFNANTLSIERPVVEGKDREVFDARSIEDNPESTLLHTELVAAITNLPNPWQMACRLCWVEDHSEKQAADIVGVSRSTLQYWLKKGKDCLASQGFVLG